MQLLRHREYIKTECSFIGEPILKVQALKIDADNKSLKQQLGCKNLKSCDYLKRKSKCFYFIELSDLHAQLINLKTTYTQKEALKIIKEEIRLKLSESLHIYNQLTIKTNFTNNMSLKKKALLALCKEKKQDVVAFDFMLRDFQRHYTPTFLNSIKFIPYTELENILK
jgi:hypothetical protein